MSLHDGEKDKRATPTTPTTAQTIYLFKAFEGPKMSLPFFCSSLSSHLLDRELCIAAVAVLLYSIEDKVAPCVDVQLPGLLLQVLHGELEVCQSGGELALVVGCLLLGLSQAVAELVEVPHDVGQGLIDSLLPIFKFKFGNTYRRPFYLLLN